MKSVIRFLTAIMVCFSSFYENLATNTSFLMIADFTQNEDISLWCESSDTVRPQGMSKSSIVLQETKQFKRAVIFTLLNPQPDGAGFAGMTKNVSLDLSNYRNIHVRLRGQGQYKNFKMIMRHRGHRDTTPAYSHYFVAPQDFEELMLEIDNFLPYFRGKPAEDAGPLDKSEISTIGFQAYGGVYIEDHKQSGVACLEVEWIKAL